MQSFSLARFLAVCLLACLATRTLADWTYRCEQMSVTPTLRFFRGTEQPGQSLASPRPPTPTGDLNSCVARLHELEPQQGGASISLTSPSRFRAPNARIRATLNANPAFAPQGVYLIAVRSNGTPSQLGYFVRFDYATDTLQILRKATLQTQSATLASVSVPFEPSQSNRIEIRTAGSLITVEVYDASGTTLLGQAQAVDSTSELRFGDVYFGGEVSRDGAGNPIGLIDLTFADISVVAMNRATDFTGFSGETVHWTLPPDTNGRFVFFQIQQPPSLLWIQTEPVGGFDMSGFFVRATGDLDQDAGGDVLFHNPDTGLVRRLAYDVARFDGTQAMFHVTAVPTGWTLSTACDLTGDGDCDLIFQNDANNVAGVLTMRRTAVTGWQGLPYVPPPYRIVGSGDFDRDGHFDLLWFDTTNGAVYLGRMRGTQYLSFNYLGFAPPSEWRVCSVLDYNNDNVLDIMWQNTQTGAVGLWLLNSNATAVAEWRGLTIIEPAWRGAN